MEPNSPIVSSTSNIQDSAAGRDKTLKIMVAVLVIVALGGVGFGIFGMCQGQSKDKQVEDAQIEDVSGANTESENGEVETVKNDVASTVTDLPKPVVGGPYIKEGYFYVPEWGWKFRIPEDLTGLGFAVDYDEAYVGYDLPFIGFTAVLKSDLIQNPQTQYYDSILNCSVIEVNRTEKGKNNYAVMGDSKEIGGYVLRISNVSSDFCNFNRNIDQVYAKLRTMFQNPEEI